MPPIIEQMTVWNAVSETDPQYTKPSRNESGFEFTSVDPYSQLRVATSMWGPYGDRWGVRELKWTHIETGAAGTLLLEADFFYPNVEGGTVCFPYAVEAKLRPGADTCKMMQTALRSKCLSLLGFNADAYLGKWDDDQYRKDLTIKHGDHQAFLQTQALPKIHASDKPEQLATHVASILRLFKTEAITAYEREVLESAILEQCDKHGIEPAAVGLGSASEER